MTEPDSGTVVGQARARIRGRVDQRGSSAFEVMLALVILSTAILGTAAAQAAAWRVLAGTRMDTTSWAVIQREAESLLALGYDRVTPGTRTVGGESLRWTVTGLNPKIVTVIGSAHFQGDVVSDTVRLVLRPTP